MSKTRRGLGSGLSILLGNNAVFDIDNKNEKNGSLVIDLDLNLISNNPEQPRKTFDINALNELADSIKIHGVLQPILVAEDEDNFIIIAGERRYRASKIVGLNTIPAIVLKHKTTEEQYQISILENIQREDLNPVEEAEAYKFLIDNFNYTHEALADKLHKSRSYITNSLRILKLPETVIDMLSDGVITQGHAKILSGVNDNVIEIAKEIQDSKMSVRDLEVYIKDKNKPKKQTTSDKVRKKILDMINEKSDSQFDKNNTLKEIAAEISEITGYQTQLIDNNRNIFMNLEIGNVKDLATMVDVLLKNFDLKAI